MLNQLKRFAINIEFGVDKKIEYLEMLHEMLSYGMTLVQVYEKLFPKVFKKGVVYKLNHKVIQGLSHGEPISLCFYNYFPRSVVSLIQIGEQAGNLKDGLLNAIAALKWGKNSINPALSSLLYPVMVIISSSVLFVYYEKILLQLLESFKGKQPPEVAKLFISIASFYQHDLFVFLIIVIFIALGLKVLLPRFTGRVREKLSNWPIFKMYKWLQGAYWLKSLGLYLQSGIMINDALKLMKGSGTKYLSYHCNVAEKRLSRGVTNIGLVLDTGLVKNYYVQVMSIAFETNMLAQKLSVIGENIFANCVKSIAKRAKYFGYILLTWGRLILPFQCMRCTLRHQTYLVKER